MLVLQKFISGRSRSNVRDILSKNRVSLELSPDTVWLRNGGAGCVRLWSQPEVVHNLQKI